MTSYRRIAIGENAPDAVTLEIERNGEGAIMAVVWWPSKGDIDADEANYASVPEALAAAEAARELHGFAEVVVTLQSDDLWQNDWGTLSNDGPGPDLTSDETFELARATEANRDA